MTIAPTSSPEGAPPTGLGAGGSARLGFKTRKIGFCLVFGAQGQVVAIEDFGPDHQLWVPKPPTPNLCDDDRSEFLWGPAATALGGQRDRRSISGYRIAPSSFNRFRTFHEHRLDGALDTSLLGFLRFLRVWSPTDLESWPEIVDRLECNLVFRFRYDDELLHERHAARLAWRRILVQTAAKRMEDRALIRQYA